MRIKARVEPPAVDPKRVQAILDADKPKKGRSTSSSRAAGAKQIGRIANPRENPVARLLDQPAQTAEVDADELALPFDDFAGDQHGLDIARVHHRHHRSRHVVQWEDIDTVGRQHNDVGFLARRERADRAASGACENLRSSDGRPIPS